MIAYEDKIRKKREKKEKQTKRLIARTDTKLVSQGAGHWRIGKTHIKKEAQDQFIKGEQKERRRRNDKTVMRRSVAHPKRSP